MTHPAAAIARSLQRNALAAGGLTAVVLLAAPLLATPGTLVFSALWPLLWLSALIAAGICAHLLLDAALFRLIASHDDVGDGCAAVDNLLARVRLRAAPVGIRPLNERMAGSRRLIRRQRLAVTAVVVLFGLLVVLPDIPAGS